MVASNTFVPKMPDDMTPARGAFLSHANYIQAFDHLMSAYYLPDRGLFTFWAPLESLYEAIAVAVRASRLWNRLQRRPQTDVNEVTRILRNAWSTESLLALTGEFATDEIIGTANNWAVVQGYYASYHVSQALFVARGDARANTHETGQSQFAAFWARPSISLPPWSLGWGPTGYLNVPNGIEVITPRSPWIGCDDRSCWGLLGMALRTTRNDTIDEQLVMARERKRAERRRLWRQQEAARLAEGRRARAEPAFPRRPQLTGGEKQQVMDHVRAHGILDYLYRLRIRSNYLDTTMFEDGPERVHLSSAMGRQSVSQM